MAEILTRRSLLSFQREDKQSTTDCHGPTLAARGAAGQSSKSQTSTQESSSKRNSSSFSLFSFRLIAGFLLQCVLLFKDYLKHCSLLFTTGAVVAMATSLRGDLLLVTIVTYKSIIASDYHRDNYAFHGNDTNSSNETLSRGQGKKLPTTVANYKPVLPDYLQLPDEYNLKDLLYFIIIAITSSVMMYHLVCAFLKIYFYVLQRHEPEKWKCQPHRFLTRSNKLHEAVTGTINLVLASTVSGVVVCWIMNGNHSTVYFRFDEYGYPYLLVSMVILFVWFEGGAYYSHTLLHTPWLYKTVHKHHHRYHSPTPYAAVAMSPFEMAFYQSIFLSPLFLFPIHGLVFITVLVYIYYFSIIDHSGIKMTSIFPWQPETMFHDDHHRYFHCNFGFNSYLFDWLHGTMRRRDRLYGEDIFWGRGRKKEQ